MIEHKDTTVPIRASWQDHVRARVGDTYHSLRAVIERYSLRLENVVKFTVWVTCFVVSRRPFTVTCAR